MTEYRNNLDAGQLVASGVLFIFTCGAMFLHGKNQLVVLGMALALTALVAGQRYLTRFPKPLEWILYTVWVAWAGLGYLFAASTSAWWETFQVVFQLLVMIWATYALIGKAGTINAVLFGVIAGGCIQVVAMSAYPELVIDPSARYRFEGIGMNPNTYGFRMIWASSAVLYFWKGCQNKNRNILLKVLMILAVATFTYGVILSGSRKSAIAIVVFLAGWIWILLRPRTVFGVAKMFVLLGAAVGALYWGIDWTMENTYLGERFDIFLEKGHGSVAEAAQSNIRYWMYVDGLKMFFDNPLFGVGLGNFQVHFFTHSYSHSNYIEPLACTGLIGFILYMAPFAFVFARLTRCIAIFSDPTINYRLRCLRLTWIVIMLLGVGAPWHTNITVFQLLVAMSSLTWMLVMNQKQARFGKTAPGLAPMSR